MTTNQKKCFIKGNWWTGDYYNHEWIYEPTEKLTKRVCLVCKTREGYFGSRSFSGYEIEDWRLIE